MSKNNIRKFDGIEPKLGNNVFVDDFAVVTGKVNLGNDVSVWPFASVRGDLMPISIGNYSNVQDNCVLHTAHDGKYNPGGVALNIGSYVTIGHGAILHACTIMDDVLIGMGAIVLDKAVVNSYTIIAAGCVVPPGKVLESGFVWVGSPAKKARAITNAEKEFFRYSTKHYVELKNKHLKEQN